MGEAIQAEGLTTRRGELDVLDSVSFSLSAGSLTAVVGPSGCGKSTLLEIVAGLAEQDLGSISVGGSARADERLLRCAWMPQRDCLLPWMTALDNAAIPLVNRGMRRTAAREVARDSFDRVGLGGFESYLPGRLSGGMRQRVAFARTLLSGKDVLLLDEPFASLDGITRAELQEWIGPLLEDEERTSILVTHDLEEAIYLCDRVIVLSPRPARVVATVEAPDTDGRDRLEAIASPEFIETHREIADRLREGARP
jgi:ABC-type nitrate/sulfonate/bicarbonate transport system ATPase subunit